MRPEHVQDPPAHVDEVLDALPPRSLTPAGGSARAHHAFTHTVHGGLGRVAACVFDALDDGAHGGLSVRQIAALTGLRPARSSGTWSRCRPPTSLPPAAAAAPGPGACPPATHQLQGAPDAASGVLGSTGTTARRAGPSPAGPARERAR